MILKICRCASCGLWELLAWAKRCDCGGQMVVVGGRAVVDMLNAAVLPDVEELVVEVAMPPEPNPWWYEDRVLAERLVVALCSTKNIGDN